MQGLLYSYISVIDSIMIYLLLAYSGFLPQSKDIHVRLTGGSCECAWLFVYMWLCGGLVPVQVEPLPFESWDRLQQTPVILNRTKR